MIRHYEAPKSQSPWIIIPVTAGGDNDNSLLESDTSNLLCPSRRLLSFLQGLRKHLESAAPPHNRANGMVIIHVRKYRTKLNETEIK